MLSRRRILTALLPPTQQRHAVYALDGRVLDLSAAEIAAAPGSALKPLYSGLLDPSLRFQCQRKLAVGSHRLDCSHAPLLGPVDLETALAASCNSWFAQAAARLDPAAVVRAIRAQGGEVVPPAGKEQPLLVALGVDRVRFTPLALARAYARLKPVVTPAVLRGLSMALESGTAAAARGLYLAGKTGTVLEGGWFAGWTDRLAVAVFIPGGSGAHDAAPAALRLAQKWHSEPAA